MNTIPQLSMPKPCAQPWGQMKPVDTGRFCEQCSTTVIDFTKTDQVEISKTLRKSGGSVCGRLRSSQLRNVRQINVNRTLRRFCLAIVLVFGLTLFNMPLVVANSLQEQCFEYLQDNQDTVKAHEIVIRGTITDEETGEPLPFVPVSVQGHSQVLGVHTDMDGNYILRLNLDDLAGERFTLTVRYIGYRSIEITDIPAVPGKVLRYDFKMKFEDLIIVGIVIEPAFDQNPHSSHSSTTSFDDLEDW